MPKITVDHKPCFISVHHVTEPVTLVISGQEITEPRRLTRIKFAETHEKTAPLTIVQTICHPGEQFTRREGRSRASNKLLAHEVVRKLFPTKQQRRELFLKICPEYASLEEVKIRCQEVVGKDGVVTVVGNRIKAALSSENASKKELLKSLEKAVFPYRLVFAIENPLQETKVIGAASQTGEQKLESPHEFTQRRMRELK